MSNELNVPKGQLLQSERDYLTQLVLNIKPNVILESGTWYGGGSTLSLVKGLYENKKGILHTVEEHKPFFDVANNYYLNSKYCEYIKLYNNSFVSVINELDLTSVDLVFLDGGDENPNGHPKLDLSSYLKNYNISENVNSFKILENKVKSGTNIILHDWCVSNGRGNFVKRYLEETNKIKEYELIYVQCDFTGFAHLIKL